jgi:hypothetical protein
MSQPASPVKLASSPLKRQAEDDTPKRLTMTLHEGEKQLMIFRWTQPFPVVKRKLVALHADLLKTEAQFKLSLAEQDYEELAKENAALRVEANRAEEEAAVAKKKQEDLEERLRRLEALVSPSRMPESAPEKEDQTGGNDEVKQSGDALEEPL